MDVVQILLIYLLTGCLSGLLGGLFGLGGGIIIVPALIFVFTWQGVDAAVLTHLAVGSSLAAILVTAISSTRAHHAKGAVHWPVALALAPGLCLGVMLGAVLAASLSGAGLQLLFGVFACAIAVQMGFGLQPAGKHGMPGKPVLAGAGGVIGAASAVFGIGGGSLTVPFLSWRGLRMQEAVATSAAGGVPIALVGAASYAVTGWQANALPAFSTGYLYWPAIVGIVATSALFATLGAKLAHRLPAALLKRAFAVFLFLLGLQFIFRNAQGFF